MLQPRRGNRGWRRLQRAAGSYDEPDLGRGKLGRQPPRLDRAQQRRRVAPQPARPRPLHLAANLDSYTHSGISGWL
jgi:hypothetical protein